MGSKPIYFACKHGIPEYDNCEHCTDIKIGAAMFKSTIWSHLKREGGQYTVIETQESIIIQKVNEQNDSE